MSSRRETASLEGPSPRRRVWAYRFTMVLFGLLVGAVLGEVVVRIAEPPADSEMVAVEYPGRLYGYPPNSSGMAGGVPFHTNELGLRGQPQLQPSDDDFVIAVLGDSYAFGYGVAWEDTFGSVIEERLGATLDGSSVRSFAIAFPGYNTAQQLAALRQYSPMLRPDVIVLAYHLNDIERHASGAEDTGPTFSGLVRSLRERVHLLRLVLPRLASVARATGVDITTTASSEVDQYLRDGPAWRSNQRTLEELIAFCRDRELPLLAMVLPYMVQFTDDHPPLEAYYVAQRFLEEHGVPTRVVFEDFLGLDAGSMWINAFDGHPNARAHRIIGEAAAELLRTHGLVP